MPQIRHLRLDAVVIWCRKRGLDPLAVNLIYEICYTPCIKARLRQVNAVDLSKKTPEISRTRRFVIPR